VNVHDQIREVADALTEPHLHSEPIPYWDNNRNRKFRRHQTVQPGLIAQLYESVIPASSGADPAASGVPGSRPGSRPPLAVEALSRHDTIAVAVLRWCRSLHITVRVSVESNVRALVGASAVFDDDTARVLLSELRQWQRWCSVLTGWENVYRPAGVPCPAVDCGKVNSLRINLTTKTAMCRACGAAWSDDDGTLGLLGNYICTVTDRVVQRAS
jgi:hypothetical protein